jgi:hypothetical protein
LSVRLGAFVSVRDGAVELEVGGVAEDAEAVAAVDVEAALARLRRWGPADGTAAAAVLALALLALDVDLMDLAFAILAVVAGRETGDCGDDPIVVIVDVLLSDEVVAVVVVVVVVVDPTSTSPVDFFALSSFSFLSVAALWFVARTR